MDDAIGVVVMMRRPVSGDAGATSAGGLRRSSTAELFRPLATARSRRSRHQEQPLEEAETASREANGCAPGMRPRDGP